MAKQITRVIKLQIPAGKATPAPPVGTVLGPAGINLQEFCTKYNDATREQMGNVLPVEISIYDDRSFDFVIKTDKMIYGIETNFYGGGGSKLNETARSYKMLSQEADTIDGFTFVWFTDGIGWKSARGNLRETFEVMDTIYSINDMENGVMKVIFD